MCRLLPVAAGILVAGCISPKLDEADSARRFLILREVDDSYRGVGRAGVVYCLCTGIGVKPYSDRVRPDEDPLLGEVSRNLMLSLQQAIIPGSPSFVSCDRCRFTRSPDAERGSRVRIVIETLEMAGDVGKFIIAYERPDYLSTETLLLRRESNGWEIARVLRMTET